MSQEADKPQNDGVQQEVEAKLPGGTSLRVRGTDILGVGTFLIVVMAAYLLWEHKGDAKDIAREISLSLKEMTREQHMMTQAQRESNCLLALPPEQRERSAEFCKRVTR